MATRSKAAALETPARGGSNYVQMSEDELVRRRECELATQEASLDEIERGAKQLTHMARTINTAVVDSTQLIGAIDHRVGRVHGDLELGEARARLVNTQKGRVCKLYVVIALLVLVEILLAAFHVPFFDFSDSDDDGR